MILKLSELINKVNSEEIDSLKDLYMEIIDLKHELKNKKIIEITKEEYNYLVKCEKNLHGISMT